MAKRATRPSYKRLAVVFDLDDTLAPDTYASVVESCGVDPQTFERESVKPLVGAGWDEILAKFYALIQESERRGGVLTADHLAQVGRGIRYFDGVPEMFERVERTARDLLPQVEVEFYILSSGLGDIARNLRIADRFKKTWGCEFHFGDRGEVKFARRLITHPEKVRYLLALSKGMRPQADDGSPADVYRDVSMEQLHVPLDQVIYLGDGASDLPAFDLLNSHHGVPIGIYKGKSADSWHSRSDMRKDARIENLAPADFSEGSELMRSLLLAVEQVCKRIALRQLGEGE